MPLPGLYLEDLLLSSCCEVKKRWPHRPPFHYDYPDMSSGINLLLVECLSYVNGASYGATYHGVVTDAEEAHHLYVSRN